MNEKELYRKLQRGECTKEDAAEFIKWYFSDSGRSFLENEIDSLWEMDTNRIEFDEKQVFDKVQSLKNRELVVSYRSDIPGEIPSLRKSSKKNRWIKIWASVACSAIIAGSYFWYDDSLKVMATADSEIAVITNPPGRKSSFYLSDGTLIMLNSNSSLTYPVNFNTGERQVELIGEAYFEVAKSNQPFVVKTFNTITTALGTTFNIGAFESEKQERIALVSGSIEVRSIKASAQDKIRLNPGEGVLYSKSDDNLVKTNLDVNQQAAWTKKELVFMNEDFKEVIRHLERWYGVKISYDHTIDGSFSGSFKNESLRAVLEGLSYTFSFKYNISDKHVTITGINQN